jgi:D-ribose pyranase
MKKTGMLNSSISKVLADLGHTDWIVIGNVGLPIPQEIQKQNCCAAKTCAVII